MSHRNVPVESLHVGDGEPQFALSSRVLFRSRTSPEDVSASMCGVADQGEQRNALRALIGSPCLVRDQDDELRGRIREIGLECVLENLEQSIDLTIFIVDLGFGYLRELAGSELSFNKKR